MASLKQSHIGLLDIPAEIRIQIYSNVLDIATVSTGIGTVPRLRVPAKKKLRLLLVNKSIFAEALPIFYEHHTVCVRINDYPQPRPFFPIHAHRRFDFLVNLQIVLERDIYDLDTVNSDIDISRHLRFVDQTCKYLKTLLLELRPTNLAAAWMYQNFRWRRQLNKHSQQSTGPHSRRRLGELSSRNEPNVIDKNGKTVKALRSIWNRLDRLTIVLPTEGDYGLLEFTGYVKEQLLQAIEPEKTWCFAFDDRDRWTNAHTGRWTWLVRIDRSRKWIERERVEK